MSWFQVMGFETDPYSYVDPPLIPDAKIEWNRDDLALQRSKLNHFLDDAAAGNRSALLAIGAIGSGKTWLSRVIGIEYHVKVPQGIVLRTKIPKAQPDFETVYQIFIESLLSDPRFLQRVTAKVGDTDQAKWREYFGNEDLGNAFYYLKSKSDTTSVAKNWLLGNQVPASEMRQAGLSVRLSGNAVRAETLRKLLQKCVELFGGTLLHIDELENASPALGASLSDVLRDLMDSFIEKFNLCCYFTAQSVNEWYDYGYSDALLTRMMYRVSLDPVQPKSAPAWLARHNKLYRVPGFKGDQLEPFTAEGLKRMIEIMPPARVFPRFIFINCGLLAREAATKKVKKIDAKFVDSNRQILDFVEGKVNEA